MLIVGHSRLALVEPATPFEDERRVLDEVLEAHLRTLIDGVIESRGSEPAGRIAGRCGLWSRR